MSDETEYPNHTGRQYFFPDGGKEGERGRKSPELNTLDRYDILLSASAEREACSLHNMITI